MSPSKLYEAYSAGLAGDELAHQLASVWQCTEWPLLHMRRNRWLEVFHACGFIEEGRRTERPKHEPLRVYRGCVEGHDNGLSWSTSLARAGFVASHARRQTGMRTHVVMVDVPADRVLAHFRSKGEHEIVADVDGLPLATRPPLRSWQEQYWREQPRIALAGMETS